MAKYVFTDIRYHQEDKMLRAYDADSVVIGEVGLDVTYEDSPDKFARAYRKAEKKLLESLTNKGDSNELSDLQEALSFSERERLVSHAFRMKFNPPTSDFSRDIPFDQRPFVREVYDDFLLVSVGPSKFRVNYTMDAQQNVVIDERTDWQKAELEVVVVESAVLEMNGVSGDTALVEHSPLMVCNLQESGDTREADIVLVQPGWGNPRDKHFYPPEVLRRDSVRFKGVPMYATNHKLEEQNPRNRVATIIESGKRFTEEGGPIARIAVQKGWFWEDLKMLDKYGLLHTVHNSIMALGRSVKGSVQGKPGNIVQEIVEPRSVDFVNRAGAGGHVLSLVESMLGAGDLAILSADYVLEKRPDIVTAILLSEQNELMAQISENADKVAGELRAAKLLRKELLMKKEDIKEDGGDAEVSTGTVTTGAILREVFHIMSKSEDFAGLPALSRERVFGSIVETFTEGEALPDPSNFEKIVTECIASEVAFVKQVLETAGNVGINKTTTSTVVGNGGVLKEDGGAIQLPNEEERIKAVDAVIESYS